MKKKIVLWLDSPEHLNGYLWCSDWEACKSITGREELGELVTGLDGDPMVLLFPGEFCRYTLVQLPNRRKDALKTVIYQLEEDALGDLDQIHWTLLDRPKNKKGDKQPILIADKEYLGKWLCVIKELELSIDAMLPDFMVPYLLDDHRVVQWGERLLSGGPVPGTISIGLSEKLGVDLAGDNIESVSFDALARALPDKGLPSLLTGSFKTTNRSGTGSKLAMMFAAILSLLLINWAIEYRIVIDLKQENAQAAGSIEQLFSKALPESSKMVDPVHQVRIALDARVRVNTVPEVLSLLHPVAEILGTSGLTIKKLAYHDASKALDISLSASDEQRSEIERKTMEKSLTVETSAEGFVFRRRAGD